MAAWFRLSLVFSIAGLLASRIGLLVHEFIGHGGMAYALGGSVPHWRLFLFGGGWIQYNRDPWYTEAQELCVILGGVASELLFASVVWAVSTRLSGFPKAMARIAAMLLCAHVCVYISTGTHYGYGDGSKLHALLSPLLRNALVTSLSLMMALLAYALAKQALLLAALLEIGSGNRRIGLTALAVLVATIVHGGLYYGEQLIIDPDETYEATMLREVERRAASFEAMIAKQRRDTGELWTVQQGRQARAEFVRKHKPWPLRALLVLLGALASAVACWRFRRTESDKLIAWRVSVIRGPSIALALTMLAILFVDALG